MILRVESFGAKNTQGRFAPPYSLLELDLVILGIQETVVSSASSSPSPSYFWEMCQKCHKIWF